MNARAALRARGLPSDGYRRSRVCCRLPSGQPNSPVPDGMALDALGDLRWVGFPRPGSPAWYDEPTAFPRGSGRTWVPRAPEGQALITDVKPATVASGRAFARCAGPAAAAAGPRDLATRGRAPSLAAHPGRCRPPTPAAVCGGSSQRSTGRRPGDRRTGHLRGLRIGTPSARETGAGAPPRQGAAARGPGTCGAFPPVGPVRRQCGRRRRAEPLPARSHRVARWTGDHLDDLPGLGGPSGGGLRREGIEVRRMPTWRAALTPTQDAFAPARHGVRCLNRPIAQSSCTRRSRAEARRRPTFPGFRHSAKCVGTIPRSAGFRPEWDSPLPLVPYGANDVRGSDVTG